MATAFVGVVLSFVMCAATGEVGDGFEWFFGGVEGIAGFCVGVGRGDRAGGEGNRLWRIKTLGRTVT